MKKYTCKKIAEKWMLIHKDFSMLNEHDVKPTPDGFYVDGRIIKYNEVECNDLKYECPEYYI